MRSSRRWLAGVMILGVACAQFVSLAHACMNGLGAHPARVAVASTVAMPADCPMVAEGTAATDTRCDAHSVPREQVDNGADVRVAWAPPSILVVRLTPVVTPSTLRATRPFVRNASPPLSLLSNRFLI